MRIKKLTGLKYLSRLQSTILKTNYNNFSLNSRFNIMFRENRREREYFDEKGNIKFKDFV